MSTRDGDDLDGLLLATSRGDRERFAELYRCAGPTLFGICLRLLRRRDRAEDVLQEGFVRIWQKAHLFDPAKGAALPWMIVLVRRCALDRLRQYRNPEPEELIEADHAGALAIEPTHVGQDLRRCLDELPEDPRRAILLAYVWGSTHRELAVQLQAPIGTVKSWIRRSLLQLKGCLDR